MYYILVTGRIVTEHDLRKSYEICTGKLPDFNPEHFKEWAQSTMGIVRSVPKDEVTVKQLVRGNCKVEAIRKYKAMHGCTLREAKEAIDKM